MSKQAETISVLNQDIRSPIMAQSDAKRQFGSGSTCLIRYVYNEMKSQQILESVNSFYHSYYAAVIVTYPDPKYNTCSTHRVGDNVTRTQSGYWVQEDIR